MIKKLESIINHAARGEGNKGEGYSHKTLLMIDCARKKNFLPVFFPSKKRSSNEELRDSLETDSIRKEGIVTVVATDGVIESDEYAHILFCSTFLSSSKGCQKESQN